MLTPIQQFFLECGRASAIVSPQAAGVRWACGRQVSRDAAALVCGLWLTRMRVGAHRDHRTWGANRVQEKVGGNEAAARQNCEARSRRWVVDSKPPFAGPNTLIEYLGRYTHRVAISNHRLVSCDADQVRSFTATVPTATA
jgi:hypothetical protein